MRRHLTLLAVLLALVLPALVAAVPTADDAARGAAAPTVHPEIRAQLSGDAAEARLDVIVTAWDQRGLAALDEVGVEHRKLRTIPIALARLTAVQLEGLRDDTRLRSLWPVEEFELFLDEGTQLVGADRVAQDHGVRGEGVVVGVIDTGIDTTHPDLDGDKVLGNFQVVGDLDGPVLVDSPFTDDHGHGTHVSSTIAGDDEFKDDANGDMSGVAPKAQLYGYAINVGTTVQSSLAIVAFDDLIARKQAGENIVAASNSWGGGDGTYSPNDPLSVATKALFDNGIVPVFAAGNDGPGLMTASRQCTIPWTFCVGAITKGRTLAGFSSRGRTPTETIETRPDGVENAILAGNHDVALGQALEVGVYRPNVSAPGVDIEAACSAAAGCPGGYQFMSGTSMATPHVSGVIALVQSARLSQAGTLLSADEVTRLVEGTANRMPGYELWEVGTGEVDALEAVNRVFAAGTDAVDIPTANYGATTADGGAATTTTHSGQVMTNSWQTGEGAYVDTFEVASGTGKLTALLTWGRPTDNIYLNLYAPGLVPGEDPPTAQSAGLLDGTGPYMRMYRELEVHFPQAGTWTLEVHGRTNAPTEATVEITRFPVERPDVTLETNGELLEGTTTAQDLTAPAFTGVTRTAIPGTTQALEVTGTPTDFYLHSLAGNADNLAGVILVDPPTEGSFDTTAPTSPVSKVSEITQIANDAYAGNFLTAYWRGQVEGAISGDVTFTAWVSSPTSAAFSSSFSAKLFSVPEGYTGIDEARQIATGATTAVIDGPPTEVTLTFENVVSGDLTGRDLILQLHSTFIDTGHIQVWHDSTTHPTRLTIPVLDPADVPLVPPAGLEVTDHVGGGATLDWQGVAGADSYVVERSSSPDGGFEQIGTTSETSFVDGTAPVRQTSYYRVRSMGSNGASSASALAYATPVDDAAFVEVKFGTYGPWELALLRDDGTWVYPDGTSSTECTQDTTFKGPDKAREKAKKGKGWQDRFGGCEGDAVTTGGLPDGEPHVRASRWFTTSSVVTAAE
ncbi:MAG: S8 family serine peptidase [Nitriliruptorales bacterium]|nr:S8 family serine peptidase [Nitriliruptorales bacterium]